MFFLCFANSVFLRKETDLLRLRDFIHTKHTLWSPTLHVTNFLNTFNDISRFFFSLFVEVWSLLASFFSDLDALISPKLVHAHLPVMLIKQNIPRCLVIISLYTELECAMTDRPVKIWIQSSGGNNEPSKSATTLILLHPKTLTFLRCAATCYYQTVS